MMGDTRGPIFQGRPSPSLRRMRQMRAGHLREHLVRLRREAVNRQQRLDNLRSAYSDSADAEKRRHIKRVSLEISRLEGLIEEGWRLYQQRKQ